MERQTECSFGSDKIGRWIGKIGISEFGHAKAWMYLRIGCSSTQPEPIKTSHYLHVVKLTRSQLRHQSRSIPLTLPVGWWRQMNSPNLVTTSKYWYFGVVEEDPSRPEVHTDAAMDIVGIWRVNEANEGSRTPNARYSFISLLSISVRAVVQTQEMSKKGGNST